MDVGNISPKRKNSKHKHMKPKDFALRCLAVVCAVVIVSCVDKNYNLDDVSTEVTVITNKTKLFIGELENKSIGDLLGDKEVDGLVKDENGNYTYSYSGKGEPQAIEGIDASYTVPGIENKFKVDYPSFNLDMEGIHIEEESYVEVGDNFIKMLPESGKLPSYVASTMPAMTGSLSKTFSGEDMHMLFDLPEQVDNIAKIIFFKDIESGHHGAPMHLTVDFGGFSGINGGGIINFKLNIEGGKFRIVDENGDLLTEGNEFSKQYTVAAGAD